MHEKNACALQLVPSEPQVSTAAREAEPLPSRPPTELAPIAARIPAAQNDPYGLPPVMTVEETAAFLRLNIKTVYDAVRNGDIPGRRVGKRTVILRDALLHCLEERVLPRPRRRP